MRSISVVMATFNGERFLAAQLDSLAAQIHPPCELLVGDDGSTDATLDLLHDFAGCAPFPVVIHRNAERLDYRANFMATACRARGELIAFCDQDDVWHPEKLARIAGAFDSPARMLVVHGAELIDEAGRVLGLLDQGEAGDIDLFDRQGPWCLVPGFAQVFRASLLRHVDLWAGSRSHFQPDLVMGHDRWIAFVAASLGTVRLLPDALVQYRQHGANLYGVNRPPEPAVGLRKRVAAARQEHVRIASAHQATVDRMRMLQAMASRVDERNHAALATASARFAALERRYSLRAQVQRARTPGGRAAALLRLVREGGYGDGDNWRFRKGALAEDLLINLPFGPGDRGGGRRS